MQRSLIFRTVALSITLGGLWVALTQQQPPPQPLTVEKMADDLHVIVGSGGNVAVLTTSEGVILVDDKFEQNVPEILANVKSITDKSVRYILNTHQHGDHTGGNQKLMENADIIAHANARANMVKASQPGLPRITFRNETAVFLGRKEVQAHYYGRGHTNGDAVMFFPAHRVLHTGDLFVNGAPLIDYANGGSGVAWTATLDEALKLDFDRVIPGHGPIMKRADLIAWKTSFEKVRERITKLKRDGKDVKTAGAELKTDDLAGWSGPSRSWSERSFPGLYQELTSASSDK